MTNSSLNMVEAKIIASLKKRHLKEKIFKNSGLASIILSLIFLMVLFGSIIKNGHSAFFTHQILLEIDLSKNALEKNLEDGNINQLPNEEIADQISYRGLIKNALWQYFPDIAESRKNALYSIISSNASALLKKEIVKNPNLIGSKPEFKLKLSSHADIYLKGKITEDVAEESRNISDEQIAFIKSLQDRQKIIRNFNWELFTNSDSREPESAGMKASIIGSFFIIIIVLLVAFPIGVMSALYLEELAPKNLITDIIEISINNLAAIPSIIFGLLGLVVYLNFFGIERSSSLVGGLTLALLVLPIIIIASRSAIRTIPSGVKDAATALGASKIQVMLHHTLPLSMPGIMTGTILAISRALGETAPLLMIGMVAFVANAPSHFTDPATAMPVQIYLWSDSSEAGFAEKTAAAIIVLLGFLITFNGIAVYLRKKFERKW